MINLFGINMDELEIPSCKLIPDAVPGRIASIDGDALCYVAAAVTEAESFAECKQSFAKMLDNRIAMCAATGSRIHLTGGNKGDRYVIAKVKEYQANRKGKDKPKHLATLRSWVQSHYLQGDHICVMNEQQEADDGMAQDNFRANVNGTPELSIIHSLDKDLKMCSGLHCDWNTWEIRDIRGFGYIELDRSGCTVKCVGYGTKFFWAQLLMGDTADNIPGLPRIDGKLVLRFASAAITKEITKVQTCLSATGKPLTGDQLTKATDKVVAFIDKGKPCGAVAAYDLLTDCTDDMACMARVVGLYREHYGFDPFDYTDWRGDLIRLTAGDMVIEQARLLWMRRTENECPTTFMSSVVTGGVWYG
jgi:hypothetical protein